MKNKELKKLSLEQFTVKSFTTSLDNREVETLKAGAIGKPSPYSMCCTNLSGCKDDSHMISACFNACPLETI